MRLLREPLVHFLALGAALFVIFGILSDSGAKESTQITVSVDHVERLLERWSRTWQRPPTAQELEGLIQDYVREEVLYREALLMGLDQDDTIIRRRLRQKMEFLAEDLSMLPQPADAELEAYLHENRDSFRQDSQSTFRHIYLNRDRRGEAAFQEAERLVGRLNSGQEREAVALGDPFPLPGEYDSLPESEVVKLFGGKFASRLMELPVGRWEGPVESGYGLHVVLVSERTEGRMPDLEAIREQVVREWQAARRRQENEEFYRRLREKYEMTVELPSWVNGQGERATQ